MPKPIKWILIVFAVFLSAVLVIKVLRKILAYFAGRKRGALPVHTPSPRISQPVIDSRARGELLGSAYRLNGVMEALYMLGEGQMQNKEGVIFEYTMRINGIPNASYLQEAWRLATNGYKNWTDEEYKQYARTICHKWLLSGGDIKRDERKELIVRDGTAAEYITADGQPLEENTKAVVIRPCWYYNGSVLEKGAIKRG